MGGSERIVLLVFCCLFLVQAHRLPPVGQTATDFQGAWVTSLVASGLGTDPVPASISVDYGNGWLRVVFNTSLYEESKLEVKEYDSIKPPYPAYENTRITLTQVATTLKGHICAEEVTYELVWQDCNTITLQTVADECSNRLLKSGTVITKEAPLECAGVSLQVGIIGLLALFVMLLL